MSDDIIHIGNTPIFDKLVRQMGERKFNTLLSPKGLGALQPVPIPGTTFDLPKPAQDAQRMWGISALQAAQNLKDGVDALISKEPVAYTGLEENPVLEKNVSFDDLSAHLISLNHVINEMVEEFKQKYPELTPIHITRTDELDGTSTIRVRQAKLEEQTDEDVNAAPRIAVGPLSDMVGAIEPKEQPQYFHVRGEAAVLPPIVKVSSSIGEDLPDSLYMKTSTWGSDEE